MGTLVLRMWESWTQKHSKSVKLIWGRPIKSGRLQQEKDDFSTNFNFSKNLCETKEDLAQSINVKHSIEKKNTFNGQNLLRFFSFFLQPWSGQMSLDIKMDYLAKEGGKTAESRRHFNAEPNTVVQKEVYPTEWRRYTNDSMVFCVHFEEYNWKELNKE